MSRIFDEIWVSISKFQPGLGFEVKDSAVFLEQDLHLKRRLVVQNLKIAWSRRFIPKLFVWHSSGDIVRMKWRYYRTGLYTEKKRSQWLKQWPKRKGLGDKKGELSLVEDVIWTFSKRWTGQPMESSRGLGNLQGVNEFFLFAEKRIKRFDESRFQGREMKWSASSSEDREFVLIVM